MNRSEYKRIEEQAQENGIVFTAPNTRLQYDYYVGLDLGFSHDATAICVTELKYEPVGKPYTARLTLPDWANGGSVQVETVRQHVRTIHHVLHLDRVQKREPVQVAVDVVERVNALADGSKKVSVRIGVDATRDDTFIDTFARRLVGSSNVPFTPVPRVDPMKIRSNNEHFRRSEETGVLLVPRNYLLMRGGRTPLVGDEYVFVDGKKISIPRRKQSRVRWRRNLPFKEILIKELLSFEPEVNLNTDYVRWEPRRREGYKHDDVAFAFCEAILEGEMCGYRDWIELDGNEGLPWDPADDNPTTPGGKSPILGTPLPPLP